MSEGEFRDYSNTDAIRFSIASERSRRRLLIEFVLKLYALMGLLIALGAAGYFALTMLNFTLTSEQQTSLVIAGAGVALSFMSLMILSYRRTKAVYDTSRMRLYASSSELLATWALFESISRRLLEREGDKFDRFSLRSILNALELEGKINSQDKLVLHRALELRNAVAHGYDRIPSDLLSVSINELNQIIAKLMRENPGLPE